MDEFKLIIFIIVLIISGISNLIKRLKNKNDTRDKPLFDWKVYNKKKSKDKKQVIAQKKAIFHLEKELNEEAEVLHKEETTAIEKANNHAYKIKPQKQDHYSLEIVKNKKNKINKKNKKSFAKGLIMSEILSQPKAYEI